jgi:plastocyanin
MPSIAPKTIALWAIACAWPGLALAAPGGAIVGRITFEGPPPVMPPLADAESDPGCAVAAGARAEHVVVKDGGVRDVVVRLAVGSAVKAGAPARSLAPRVIDQKGCRYTPPVVAITAGQTIAYRNSDPTMHNVHTFAAGETDFNIAQPRGAADAVHDVPTPPGDEPYRVRCDVHPWMSATVLVTDHQYHTLTRDDGSFKLENVPPGSYKLQAWHPTLGTRTVDVKVHPGKATQARFPAFTAADHQPPENTGSR